MFRIVPAGIEDIPVIRSLAYSIWPIAYGNILSKDQMDYMLELFYSESSLQQQIQHHQFLIINYNEQPVGFASFSLKESSGNIFKLHKLYVLTDHHGSGFGKTLLHEVVGQSKNAGGKFLQLNVNRNNSALQFYLKNNFEILAEEDIDIGKGYFMNDYIMQREL